MAISSKLRGLILYIVRNFVGLVDIMYKVWYINSVRCTFCIIYLQI